jgi:hypothetical protein
MAARTRGHDRLPEAAGASATTPSVCVVQRFGQELHQASRCVDVVLDLLPFDLPLPGQARNAIVIHPIGYRGSLPARAVLDQRRWTVNGQEFQNLLDLAAAQIDSFLDLSLREAIAHGQRFKNRLDIPLIGNALERK